MAKRPPKPQPKPQPGPAGPGSGGTTPGPGPGGGGTTGGGTTGGPRGGGPEKPPDPGPGPDCDCLVMVPCTTGLKGRFKVSVHDSGQQEDQFVEVECRVHAIGYRGRDVVSTSDNAPKKAGTHYLITLEELEWHENPMWVHEASSNLNLGY